MPPTTLNSEEPEIYLHLTSDEEGFTEEEASHAVSRLD